MSAAGEAAGAEALSAERLAPLLDAGLQARAGLLDAGHESALRLFSGFTEGFPALTVDLYGRTLLLHNYAAPPELLEETMRSAQELLLARLPWVRAVVVKPRRAVSAVARRGALIWGTASDRSVREAGVRYAVDLLQFRDAGLYLDTRVLRDWARTTLAGRTVLNAFAYTGSLGVAAMAGGAARVLHLDRSRQALNVAKTSYTLNGFPIRKADFLSGDFWTQVERLKRAGERFDCVFLDPPFFAATDKGTVDLVHRSHRVINKVRPLISDGGTLVTVNNALFVGGAAYLEMLKALCADGYLSVEALIPVPEDVTGYPTTRQASPPVDPAPFNHPTKIAVLRVRRKPEAGAWPNSGR